MISLTANLKCLITKLAAVTLFCLLTFGPVQASTITVCTSGCDYTSITEAINAANPGDIVQVQSGTYYENVNVTKQITLMGDDTGEGFPIVDAGGRGNAITLSADGIHLERFDVTNSLGSWRNIWAGIKVASNDNLILGNRAFNNENGVLLTGSRNNSIVENNATNNLYGIRLDGSLNNTLRDNYIRANTYGLVLDTSEDNNIRNNLATNNYFGVQLNSSTGNILSGNQMHDNTANFGAEGTNHIDTSNLVDDKPIYYLVGVSDKTIDPSSRAGTIYCIDCNNMTIRDLILDNNFNGIYLYNTTNSTIENSSLRNNSYGAVLVYSSKNIISNNTFLNNRMDGATLVLSDDNTLEGNLASENVESGISVWYSDRDTLAMNIARDNHNGFGIYFSEYNNITKNKLDHNNRSGLLLLNSSNINVTMNAIANNTESGILLISSRMNEITSNKISSNQEGLRLEFSKDNSIRENEINDNGVGIAYDALYHNILEPNIMVNNRNETDQIISQTTSKPPGSGFGSSVKKKSKSDKS
jgi:parallel beta-helix repeat protein